LLEFDRRQGGRRAILWSVILRYGAGEGTQTSGSGDSGGNRHVSQSAYAVAQIRHTGNAFDPVYRMAPSYGVAEVWIDGVRRASIDQYNPTELAAQVTEFSLASGTHTVEIRRAMRQNPGSSGDAVNVDKLVAYENPAPTVTPTPTLTQTADPGATPTASPSYNWIEVGGVLAWSDQGYTETKPYTVAFGEERVLVFSVSDGVHSGQFLTQPRYNGLDLTSVKGCGPSGNLSSEHWILADAPWVSMT
jgi:hypothetical protein